MPLYHFSEDPDIRVFAPHMAQTSSIQDEALVWAIDDWHAPMYYVPRQCPRACFWAGEQTSDEDRERWFGGVEARFVICVESGWLERIRATTLYRYTLPEAPFSSVGHSGGHWTTRETVEPLAVEPMSDLLAAIADSGVELRVTPALVALWRRVIASTLEFSGTRLRNARGYNEVDWDAAPKGPYAR